VDSLGCPLDEDGDGVFDGLDQCPHTPAGARVDKYGCPVSEQEYEFLETGLLRLNNINFASGKADLLPASLPELDRVGELLSRWNELRIEISGHTDSQGSREFNRRLSEQRAASVRQYLLEHFPRLKEEQLSAVGWGESRPVADNGTPEGRALNRRVEFRILNQGGVKREVKP
jgi:OOP family OmpA-OmpF porin